MVVGAIRSEREGLVMSRRVVCFGELLLRLGPPGRQLWLQSPTLDIHVGGAEANVAVALAGCGHHAAMVSVVPENALGTAALRELRRYGVDVASVRRGDGRMGLYFLGSGAIQRPSEVIYDRADSAFARAPADRFDWPLLLDGADALHLSGITPALGAAAADAAARAIDAAGNRGLLVSFDGNFRPKLWESWRGDPPTVLRRLFAGAGLLFADHRDIAVVLGADAVAGGDTDAFAAAAQAAFAAFPALRRMASTVRVQHSVDHHTLSARMLTRDGGMHGTPAYEVTPIVDRIGTGDAFAAGVLHGLLSGFDETSALHFGLGAACLKHSVPGDFNLVSADEIAAFVGGGRLDVRR
jgi:2-dehydro-3-deoxygluconokinase